MGRFLPFCNVLASYYYSPGGRIIGIYIVYAEYTKEQFSSLKTQENITSITVCKIMQFLFFDISFLYFISL